MIEQTVEQQELERDKHERELAALKMRQRAEAEAAGFDPKVAAQRELARQEMCRRNYLPFVLRFNPDYNAGWVHKDIARRLEKFSEQVANKESPRLMLFMPPRHGKSLLTSKTFGAWHLGRYPKHEIMLCSYSGELSVGFSRSVRTLLRDPSYAPLFPGTKLNPEAQGVEAWTTTEGGGLIAAGVGGAITGRGAHIMVIDDPVKNRDDARSAAAQESIYDWYTSTAYTRLAPGGGIILIMTRWSQLDLAGRLLEAEKDGGDKWEVINYPAEAEEDELYRKKGDPLHEARYDNKALQRIRNAVGVRDWAALYQQRPMPETGDYFTRDMIQYYRKADLPDETLLVNYTAWDLAIGRKEYNDWTVGMTASLDRRDKLYIRARTRARMDAAQIVANICDTWVRWRSAETGIEKGQIEMSIEPYLDKEIAARKLYSLYIRKLAPGKRDKVLRARSIQGMMRQGKVLLPHPDEEPWVLELVDELLRFPDVTSKDDQVDALAWLGLMMDNMSSVPDIPQKKPASWRDKLLQYTGEASQTSAMSA